MFEQPQREGQNRERERTGERENGGEEGKREELEEKTDNIARLSRFIYLVRTDYMTLGIGIYCMYYYNQCLSLLPLFLLRFVVMYDFEFEFRRLVQVSVPPEERRRDEGLGAAATNTTLKVQNNLKRKSNQWPCVDFIFRGFSVPSPLAVHASNNGAAGDTARIVCSVGMDTLNVLLYNISHGLNHLRDVVSVCLQQLLQLLLAAGALNDVAVHLQTADQLGELLRVRRIQLEERERKV